MTEIINEQLRTIRELQKARRGLPARAQEDRRTIQGREGQGSQQRRRAARRGVRSPRRDSRPTPATAGRSRMQIVRYRTAVVRTSKNQTGGPAVGELMLRKPLRPALQILPLSARSPANGERPSADPDHLPLWSCSPRCETTSFDGGRNFRAKVDRVLPIKRHPSAQAARRPARSLSPQTNTTADSRSDRRSTMFQESNSTGIRPFGSGSAGISRYAH